MAITFDKAYIDNMIKTQIHLSVQELLPPLVNEAVAKWYGNRNGSLPTSQNDETGPIQQQVDQIAQSQQFICSQYDTLIKQLNQRDLVVNKRFVTVTNNMEFLHGEVDSVGQYTRRETCEWEGLQKIMTDEGKSAADAVISVINEELELPDTTVDDLCTAHGFHKDGAEDNSVVYAKFTRVATKNKVLAAWNKLRSSTTRGKGIVISQNVQKGTIC